MQDSMRFKDWGALTVAVALWGCHAPHEEPPAPLCMTSVYVGRIAPGEDCGSHGAWSGAAVGSEGLLQELCEYKWTGDAAPQPASLPGAAQGVTGLIPSCTRAFPQGDAYSSSPGIRKALYDAFMDQIGRVSLAYAAEAQPTLYIVDTIPESLVGTGEQPTARHGLTLRELGENILCDGPAVCAARVVNALGLPRVEPDQSVDLERGGSSGNLLDVARGIDAAVDDWDARGRRSPLVILLALGWEPDSELWGDAPGFAGQTLSQLLVPGGAPVDVQAVLAALTRASCRGAFIVAAAGNQTGSSCVETGPMGPAYFQQLLAPTQALCDTAGFLDLLPDGEVPTPLLLTATHIGFAGEPLANTRADDHADVAAQGVAFGTVDGDSDMLTGSSVAAAVVAAAAASVWALYPDLSRAQLRRVLQGKAEPTLADRRAPPGPSKGPPEVRLCRALQVACTMFEADCTKLPACPDPAHEVSELVRAFNAAVKSPPCEYPESCSEPNSIAIDADVPCSAPEADDMCGESTIVCPAVSLPDAGQAPDLAAAHPQPKKGYCPTCIAWLGCDARQLRLGLSFRAEIPTEHPLLIEVKTDRGIVQYAIERSRMDWHRINQLTLATAHAWLDVREISMSYYLKSDDGSRYRVSEPLFRTDVLSTAGAYLPVDECGDGLGSIAKSVCGNGFIEPGEQCDDGNANDGDDCESDCSEPFCGNGILDKGEQCDDGNEVDGDACTACVLPVPPTCGDGIVQKGEQCDDGNDINDDACNNSCMSL